MTGVRTSAGAVILFLAVFAVGVAIGTFVDVRHFSMAAGPQSAEAKLDSLMADAKTGSAQGHAHKLYVCPMHPNVVRDHPDHCPICGMDLVEVDHADEPTSAPSETTADPHAIAISPQVVNSLGVRTEKVRREDVGRVARMPAYIQGYQPGMLQVIRSPLAGSIVAMRATPGTWVNMGDVLFEIDIPGRREAQDEHLKLIAQGETGKLEDSRQRLRETGLTGEEIMHLEQDRVLSPTFKYQASSNGQVVAIQSRKGDTVRPGAVVLSLQGRGETAVDVDIFQSQAMWLKSGDAAELRVRQMPGKVWKGTITMEGLRVNQEKRTYSVRLIFPMADNPFTTDMFAEARVIGATKHKVLTVPHEALIQTEGKSRVVLALGDGRFKPVDVMPGVENSNRVEIVSGLHDGDEVVVSAQFLIDSESSLRAEFQRMSDAAAATDKPAAASPHQH
jgi:Cu(I)/Ag(I) efflux system membrane fusion protein